MLRTFDVKSPREGGRERSRWPVFETDVGTIDGQLVVVLGSGVGSGNVNRGDETCRKEGREGLLEDVDGASCTGRSRGMYIDEGYIHVPKGYKEICKASVSIDWSSIRPLRSG